MPDSIKKILEENGYTLSSTGRYESEFPLLMGMVKNNLEKNLNTVLIPLDLISDSPKEESNISYVIYVKDTKGEE